MRHILLHGHIFKNAGTTFDWSLERSFGEAFLDHREDKVMRERGGRHLAALVDDRPALRAFSAAAVSEACSAPSGRGRRSNSASGIIMNTVAAARIR